MKSLYDKATVDEVKQRMAALTPETQRLWGKMTAPQMLAHLAVSVETGTG